MHLDHIQCDQKVWAPEICILEDGVIASDSIQRLTINLILKYVLYDTCSTKII